MVWRLGLGLSPPCYFFFYLSPGSFCWATAWYFLTGSNHPTFVFWTSITAYRAFLRWKMTVTTTTKVNYYNIYTSSIRIRTLSRISHGNALDTVVQNYHCNKKCLTKNDASWGRVGSRFRTATWGKSRTAILCQANNSCRQLAQDVEKLFLFPIAEKVWSTIMLKKREARRIPHSIPLPLREKK